MEIKKGEIFKIKLPLIVPFRTGFGTLINREIVFVKLYDKKGVIGIGESANLELPLYEPEFNDSMIALLKKYLIPLIMNKKIDSISDLEKLVSSIRGNNFAKTAIESAFWHIQSQLIGRPLRKLWGGARSKIPVAVSIGLGKNLNESIKKVKKTIDQLRPKRAKIKIKPGIDIELIKTIRLDYPKLPIMVDANASYALKDIKVMQKLDKFNLVMIEQPLAYNDLFDHSLLQKKIKTPICLDESISCLHQAEQAIKIKACKIINIKPQRVGGYWQAKLIAKLAKKNQIPVWCGGMIESGWGQLFNCHIATLPNFNYENDICLTKWYLAEDILERPIDEQNGFINVASTDKQFVINEKKFKKYTVTKLEVSK